MADNLLRLRVDSQEYDQKLKQASEGLQRYIDGCRKAGGTLEHLDDGVLDFTRALGKMESTSTSARAKLSEMTQAFTDMKVQYLSMTAAERNSEMGKALSASLDQLKGRILDTKKSLQTITQELSGSKFGQFGTVVDTIGRKMGVAGNLTDILTSKTALMYAGIGAGVAVLGKATDAWIKYNREIEKQDQLTTVTTGLEGGAAQHMTDTMRALSDTYKVDFREAISAANVLMSQFGESGDSAIKLLKDGMQGMITGDGGKLLQMIQKFAPAFRDAGVSASQLIAVIHNSEGGLFTAENMNAIVFGMKNIRLMTKQTGEALAKLGIDGKQMSRDLNDGTITVFDALKKVVGELKNVDSNSQTAGEVMQAVFGRQGITAGTNIAKAIEQLNTNLDITKKQTGDLGNAFAELQTANENLNTAIRNTFEYDGYEQMATGIKAKLVSALAEVIDKLGKIKSLVGGLNSGQAKLNKYGTTGVPDEVQKDLEALRDAPESEREAMYQNMRNKYQKRYAKDVNTAQKWQNAYAATMESSNWDGLPFVRKLGDRLFDAWHVNTSRANVAAEKDVLSQFNKEAQKIVYPTKTEEKAQTTTTTTTTTTTPTTTSPTTASKQQQAQAKYEQAEQDYSQALEQITLELDAKKIDIIDARKKEMEASESLWKAIGDAREIYDIPELASEQEKVAEKVKELGGNINNMVSQQKKAQESARRLATAQNKAATAYAEMIEAAKSNDFKTYQQASRKYAEARTELTRIQTNESVPATTSVMPSVSGQQPMVFDVATRTESALDAIRDIDGVSFDDKTLIVTAYTDEAVQKLQSLNDITLTPKTVDVEVNDIQKQFTYTESNMSGFISSLKEKLSNAELGTTVYANLTAQLADAQMLANLMQTAIKNGIDIAQFNPQELFQKIFGENPGDYIEDSKWEELRQKIEEILGKPITIDVNTGQVNVDGSSKQGTKSITQKDTMGQLINNVGTMTRCLQDMGVEVPDGFSKVINSMNLVTTLLQSLQSLKGIGGGGGGIIGLVGGLFSSIFGGFFANGGRVPHAANGLLIPGNDHSDRTLIAASSGELVLNAAQEDNLANTLTTLAGANRIGQSQTIIESDQIRIVLHNGAQAKGMTIGQYLGL